MSLLTNLVSYWKLNESSGNAIDSAGSNTLTNTNGVTYSPGVIGNGANFVRLSSQKLSITDAAQNGLDFTGDMTIAGWVKFTSGGLTQRNFIGKDNGNADGYEFYHESSGNNLVFSTRSTPSPAAVSWTPSDDVWYHVAVVYTASGGKTDFYVNGAQQGTQQSGLTTPTANATDFTMGFITSGGVYLNGSMDEWGIWNRSLSSAEITQLYNTGSGLSYPFNIYAGASFLLGMI